MMNLNTEAIIIILIGLLFAVITIGQARSGKIYGRCGAWSARKDQMPILYYGLLIAQAGGAIGLLILGVIHLTGS